jgi:hypothetical protein
MMKWILYCAKCDRVLIHSEICESDLLGFNSFTNLTKPKFPLGGLSVFCASCKEASLFQRHQLVYQKS